MLGTSRWQMLRPCFLESHGSRTELRVAKYRLPLLWLACFEAQDVTVGSDAEGEEEEVLLSTSSARALLLLERRRPALETLISNLDEFLPEWSSFLRGLGEGRLVVDATEVLEMQEGDDGLTVPLRTALGALDEPTVDSFVVLLELCSLSDHLDQVTRVVSTPKPKRAREVDPDFPMPGADKSLRAEPASEALMGIPAPQGSLAATSKWPPSRRYAVISALVFALFLVQLVRTGRGPSTFGVLALAWSVSSALLLWMRPRLGSWVFASGPAIWVIVLATQMVRGVGRGSMVELLATLVAFTATFQIRAELAAPSRAARR